MRLMAFRLLPRRLESAFAVADYDVETRRSMAFSVGVRLLLLGPPFVFFYFYFDLPGAAWSITIAEGLNVLALVQLARRKNPITWGWVIVLGLLGAIFGTLYAAGGLRSPGCAWLLLSPLLACYLFGFGGAAVTAMLTVTGLASYAMWEQAFGPIPHLLPLPLQNAWNFLIVATAVLATLSITNSWMAMLQRERKRQSDAERMLSKAIGSLTEAIFIFEIESAEQKVVPRQENLAATQLRTSLADAGLDLQSLLGVEQWDVEALNKLVQASADSLLIRRPGLEISYQLHVSTWEGGYVLSLSDVSLHVGLEEQLRKASLDALEASRLKSEFLATMSHEIRTPMNGILGMTELVMQNELTDEQRECLATVHDCANNLLHLVNDILDLSKIEAGRIDLESVPFDLVEVLEGVQDGLAPKALEKGLDWNAFARPDVPCAFTGDPLRIRQVLLNLASNAIKFTEHGSVTLEVSSLPHTVPGQARLRFEVRDTGIGISPEGRARLFQKFMQADSSTTRRYGGTGLGLTISRQLVELMGGDIDLQSEVGRGTTFWFEVTLPSTGETRPVVESADLLVGRRVLVVDDVEINRRVLAGQARRIGCRYESAANAADALRQLEAAAKDGDPFFCVWTDQCMPEMTGLEFGRVMRSDRRHDSTRLMLLSSYQDFGDGAEARAAGFQSWSAKPVKLTALRDEMLRMLRAPQPNAFTPYAAAPVATTIPAVAAPSAPPRVVARERLLLAEDNAVNRKLALKLLERAGFTADVAVNGAEALAKIKQSEYDLVLMDCQMPEMDGYQASREIRALGGKCANLPILALTANAMVGDREKCLAAGMSDYLTKPLRQDDFFAALERWLGRPVAPRSETRV